MPNDRPHGPSGLYILQFLPRRYRDVVMPAFDVPYDYVPHGSGIFALRSQLVRRGSRNWTS